MLVIEFTGAMTDAVISIKALKMLIFNALNVYPDLRIFNIDGCVLEATWKVFLEG